MLSMIPLAVLSHIGTLVPVVFANTLRPIQSQKEYTWTAARVFALFEVIVLLMLHLL